MLLQTTLSLTRQQVLRRRDENAGKLIQIDHLNKKARNKAIFTLGKQGIKGVLLAEITGLSTQSISRILETGSNNSRGFFNKKERELFRLKKELEKLFERYSSFIRERKERR